MMRSAHLAPYYGIASTRKALLERWTAHGLGVPPGLTPVRVLVYQVQRRK